MYQGKYLSGAKPAAAPKKPQKSDPPKKVAPPDPQPIPQEQPRPQERPRKEEPTPKPRKQKKQRRGIRVGTVIFYLLYLIMIGAAAYGIHYGLGFVNDWLVTFEASQPDTRSKEIFQEYFADPDWGWVYDEAGIQGTQFEGKDAYVAYMEEKVGDQALTFSKTSAGLSGGEKYIVKLGDEKVATFTMQNSVSGDLEIPDWQLSGIEAGFFTREQDVTIVTRKGRTVLLNGVPLDESYTVKTTSTVVEEYLPEGVHGPSSVTVYASGFLVAPNVEVIDEDLNIQLTYDAESNTYFEAQLEETQPEISTQEYNALLAATQAYSEAMIGANTEGWRKHFVKNTEIYTYIHKLIRNDSHFKGWTRYEFEPETISEYHRYTDELFSARIQVTLNTYRKDGSVKPFEVNTTIFMTKNDSGQWLVDSMTNVDLHEVLTQVRITWMVGDEVLSSEMVDNDVRFLGYPEVTVPDGKVFVGWFLESRDAEGNKTLTRIFEPTETGSIPMPDDYVLEPMVLHARFEKQGE